MQIACDMNKMASFVTAKVDMVLKVDAAWHDALKRFAYHINAYSRFEEDGSWILTKTMKCSGLVHADLKIIMNFIQFIIPVFAKKVKTCRLRFDQFDYCYSLDDLEAGIPVWF